MSPVVGIATVLGLSALYLASVVTRTLARGRPVAPFEVFQVAAALAVGLGGAWTLLGASGMSGSALGAATVLMGGLCYCAAFAFVERHKGHGRNFYFYSTVGGALTLAGSALILGRTSLALSWCLLSLAGCWLGRRYDRMTLRLHGALYLGAAALAAGVLLASWRRPPSAVTMIVLVTALAGYALLAGEPRRSMHWRERLPHAIVGGLAAWGAGRMLTSGLAARLPAVSADAAMGATLRTAVLSGMVLALAVASRRWTLPELGWLVYPLLVVGGFWLITDDLAHGRPATLFLSLVLYGSALIAGSRGSKRAAE